MPALPAGCDTRFKRLKFDNKNIGLTLWDTAGQERFQAVTSTYYRGAQGVVYGEWQLLAPEGRRLRVVTVGMLLHMVCKCGK